MPAPFATTVTTTTTTTTALACGLGLLAFLGALPSAEASQTDLYAPSIQSLGRAGAGSVLEDGAASLPLAPAALGLGKHDTIHLEYVGGRMDLAEVTGVTRVDGGEGRMPQQGLQPQAFSAGLTKTFGPWVTAGAHVMAPIPWVYFHETKDPWVPYASRWQNRMHRAMATAGLSVRLPVRGVAREGALTREQMLQGGLWIGGGVSIRPQGIIAVELDLIGREGENEDEPQIEAVLKDVDLAARYKLRAHAGALLDFGTFNEALMGLRLGVHWRSEVTTDIEPIRLDVRITELGEVAAIFSLVERLQATVWLRFTDMYDPHQLRFSLGWSRARFAAAVDVQWNLWSGVVPSYGRVLARSAGQESELEMVLGDSTESYPIVGGRSLDRSAFHNTVDVSVGGELRPPGWEVPNAALPLELRIRLGYSFRQAFADATDGPSGLLDGDVHTGAFGLGFRAPSPLKVAKGPLTVDWGLQVLRITGMELPKTADGLAAVVDMPVVYEDGAAWAGGWSVVTGLSVGQQF